MAIILLIKTEDSQVTELPILGKVILGRSGSSDYKIADNKMSGSHCTFEVNSKGQLLFTDLGSSNGSYLNNSLVHQTLVRVNDIIRIGNTLIKIAENKLSAFDLIAIGTSLVSTKNDKTLPDMSGINDPTAASGDTKIKKKTAGLSEQHRAKSKLSSSWSVGSENLIEPEESSGQTGLLKLDKKTKKK